MVSIVSEVCSFCDGFIKQIRNWFTLCVSRIRIHSCSNLFMFVLPVQKVDSGFGFPLVREKCEKLHTTHMEFLTNNKKKKKKSVSHLYIIEVVLELFWQKEPLFFYFFKYIFWGIQSGEISLRIRFMNPMAKRTYLFCLKKFKIWLD